MAPIRQKITTFSTEAIQALIAYQWPGNVRELENIIERIIVISDGNEININDIPPKIRNNQPTNSINQLSSEVENAEERVILAALKETDGNITHAASKLGISRRSLHRKINKFNIQT